MAKDFLRQGAILGDRQQVQIFWGDCQRLGNQSENNLIYAPDFFLQSAKPWYSFSHGQSWATSELIGQLPPSVGPSPTFAFAQPDKNLFLQQFSEIRRWLTNQQLKKCVPIIASRGQLQGRREDALAMILQTALTCPTGVVYGLWTADEFIIGVTPELLVASSDYQQWQTMAVAGTTTSGEFAREPENFLADAKENLEHELVVAGIVESLASFGQVIVEPMIPQEIGGLVHLKTPMALRAAGPLPVSKVVAALHPTPALGCHPRTGWQERLSQLYPNMRGRFGAPFGVAGPAGCQLIVAIRNLQWLDDHFEIANGCGIVAESEGEKEWQELLNKRASVIGLLGL